MATYAGDPYAGQQTASGPAQPAQPTGALAVTLPRMGAALAGTRTIPAATGALAVTLPRFTAALGGTYANGRAGALAATLPRFSATLAGTHSPPPRTAALAAALPRFSAHLAAIVPVQAGRLRPFTASLHGQVAVVIATDTTYANDSYTYGGTAEVDYAPPVAPPPPGLVRRDVRRVHQSLPTPDLVRGRPQ